MQKYFFAAGGVFFLCITVLMESVEARALFAALVFFSTVAAYWCDKEEREHQPDLHRSG